MKHYISNTLFAFFLIANLYAQNSNSIAHTPAAKFFLEHLPERLKTLKLKPLQELPGSTKLRIWGSQNVFTFYEDVKHTATYTVYSGDHATTTQASASVADSLFLQLPLERLFTLQQAYFRGIDGYHVFIETSTPNGYSLINYWSPRANRSLDQFTVVQALETINRLMKTKQLNRDFLNELPAGGYRWGCLQNLSIVLWKEERPQLISISV